MVDNVCIWTRSQSQSDLSSRAFSSYCDPSDSSLVANLQFERSRLEEPSVYDDVSGDFIGFTSTHTQDGLAFDNSDIGIVSVVPAHGEYFC